MQNTASESFLDYSQWNEQRIHRLFGLANTLKTVCGSQLNKATRDSSSLDFKTDFKNRYFNICKERLSGRSAALLFFEPSTRTRMSFESACHRIALSAMILDTGGGTSLEKGETVEDSILNLAAMDPLILVVRCGNDTNLEEISKRISIPIVNAGWGVVGHPTQALLDAFTFNQQFKNFSEMKLLMVGDIKHSRVASSHFSLGKILGYKIGICGPKNLAEPPSGSGAQVEYFDNFDNALEWANVVMMLRFQFERHHVEVNSIEKSSGSYHPTHRLITPEEARQTYGLTNERAKRLKPNVLIAHPGPVIHGVEMDSEVLRLPNCVVLNQVNNGVFVRQALLMNLLKIEIE